MKEIESQRVTSPYPHEQTELCESKGNDAWFVTKFSIYIYRQ